MTSLRIKVLRDADEFAALGKPWQVLAAADPTATLFNDWHWNHLWWQHYQHLGALYILLVYQDQQLVGIAPFYKDRSKALGLFKLDTLRFMGVGGDTSPDDLNILANPALRTEVCESVCHFLFSDNSVQRMLLADVPVDTEFYKVFSRYTKAADGYSLKPIVYHRRFAELPEDWSGFREQISRNTHKQMKRRLNRLNAAGDVHMQVCASAEEVGVAYHALVKLHLARWKSKKEGRSASFSSQAYVDFHEALVHKLFDAGQLWLVTLTLNSEIIGVEYAFVYKNTLMFFQTGFNPDFENLSPGHVLMTFAIKQAIESGEKRIDMLKGDYEYKNSYTNKASQAASIGYYKPGLFSLLAKVNDWRKHRSD